MASRLPPVAGTPVNEWSQEAVSALRDPSTATSRSVGASANPADADPSQTAHPVVFDPAAKVPAASSLDPETPGPNVPGSFPRTLSDAHKPSAGETAQKYIGAIQENVGSMAQNAAHYLPQSVKEVVAPYLPEGTQVTATASGNDIEHKTAYPTTELTGAGANERTAGVGALPGRSTETGVAKLPDEKLDEATGGAPAAPGIVARAAGYLPQSVKETVAPYLPGTATATTASAGAHDATHTTSLPSTELTGAGASEHVGGVGSLPGRLGEGGVTKLPDERAAHESTNTTSGTIASAKEAVVGSATAAAAAVSHGVDTAKGATTTNKTGTTAVTAHPTQSLPSQETYGAGSEHVGGVGALPGDVGESRVAVLPDERNALSTQAGRSLPTSEAQGALAGERTGGIGALPGAVHEPNVALLPHERDVRGHESGAPVQTTSNTLQKVEQAAGAASSAAGAHIKSDDTRLTGSHTHTDTSKLAQASAAGVHSDHTRLTDSHTHTDPSKLAQAEASKLVHTDAPKQQHATTDAPNKGDAYGEGYHPAALRPAQGNYSNVETHEVGPPGEKERESRIAQPAGFKEGGDRKVHGGVPGDIGGGTMPVGDEHEGGVDSTDPKGKGEGPHKSRFMDKVKGFAHKLAPGKHDKEAS